MTVYFLNKGELLFFLWMFIDKSCTSKTIRIWATKRIWGQPTPNNSQPFCISPLSSSQIQSAFSSKASKKMGQFPFNEEQQILYLNHYRLSFSGLLFFDSVFNQFSFNSYQFLLLYTLVKKRQKEKTEFMSVFFSYSNDTTLYLRMHISFTLFFISGCCAYRPNQDL